MKYDERFEGEIRRVNSHQGGSDSRGNDFIVKILRRFYCRAEKHTSSTGDVARARVGGCYVFVYIFLDHTVRAECDSRSLPIHASR